MYKTHKHPWGAFLDARLDAIFWLKNEQKLSDKEIAETLSMDEQQVFLIRSSEYNQKKCL